MKNAALPSPRPLLLPTPTRGFSCFLFTASIELAWHNNIYRALNLSPSAAATQVNLYSIPSLIVSPIYPSFH